MLPVPDDSSAPPTLADSHTHQASLRCASRGPVPSTSDAPPSLCLAHAESSGTLDGTSVAQAASSRRHRVHSLQDGLPFSACPCLGSPLRDTLVVLGSFSLRVGRVCWAWVMRVTG